MRQSVWRYSILILKTYASFFHMNMASYSRKFSKPNNQPEHHMSIYHKHPKFRVRPENNDHIGRQCLKKKRRLYKLEVVIPSRRREFMKRKYRSADEINDSKDLAHTLEFVDDMRRIFGEAKRDALKEITPAETRRQYDALFGPTSSWQPRKPQESNG
jgi:hypothetical protein